LGSAGVGVQKDLHEAVNGSQVKRFQRFNQ
jgi:hypothetical protein